MEKYYNDKGQVGVIISPKYGAGWSTWNENNEALIFDKNLVEAVLEKDYEEVVRIANELYPDGFFSGYSNLVVVFLEPKTAFQINEYDGSESICVYNPGHYFTA